VPADARILSAATFEIDESALTGEKSASLNGSAPKNIAMYANT
jgi:magnesium-transporting ATPase (P-type)